MILDEDTDKIYIFGGRSLNLFLEVNDFYSYDIGKNSWKMLHATHNIKDPQSMS